jgi:hypothetical protein
MLLRVFNAEVGGKDIFKQIIGNKSLHEMCNYNGVGVVKYVTSKNVIIKNNTLGLLLMGRRTIRYITS